MAPRRRRGEPGRRRPRARPRDRRRRGRRPAQRLDARAVRAGDAPLPRQRGPARRRSAGAGRPLGRRPVRPRGRRRAAGDIDRFLVWPRTVPTTALRRRERWGGPDRARAGLTEDPSRFAGVREYAPGDPVRRIHPRASARLGRPIVKRFEPSRDREVLIALDVQTRPGRLWEAPATTSEVESLFVVAASVARSLAAERRGVRARRGRLHTAPSSGSPMLPVSEAPGQLERVLDLLARLSSAPVVRTVRAAARGHHPDDPAGHDRRRRDRPRAAAVSRLPAAARTSRLPGRRARLRPERRRRRGPGPGGRVDALASAGSTGRGGPPAISTWHRPGGRRPCRRRRRHDRDVDGGAPAPAAAAGRILPRRRPPRAALADRPRRRRPSRRADAARPRLHRRGCVDLRRRRARPGVHAPSARDRDRPAGGARRDSARPSPISRRPASDAVGRPSPSSS